MAKQRRRKLPVNEKLIPGIYNYCDRWCERCAFTGRCMQYAREQEAAAQNPDAAAAGGDGDDPKVWEAIVASFTEAQQMLDEECRKRGIDLTMTPEQERAAAEADEQRERAISADPLSESAFGYLTSAGEWFKAHRQQFQEMTERLIAEAEMALPGADPAATAADVADASEIINWYHAQIAMKIRRALDARRRQADPFREASPFGSDDADHADDPYDPEMREALVEAARDDADGSAKVALIGIDRSIEAWDRLRKHFPDQADSMIDTLAELDRLRRGVEARFPGARAFKRPGFDD